MRLLDLELEPDVGEEEEREEDEEEEEAAGALPGVIIATPGVGTNVLSHRCSRATRLACACYVENKQQTKLQHSSTVDRSAWDKKIAGGGEGCRTGKAVELNERTVEGVWERGL